jgi:hypothetical protein
LVSQVGPDARPPFPTRLAREVIPLERGSPRRIQARLVAGVSRDVHPHTCGDRQ